MPARIMVIDDEPLIARTIERILDDYEVEIFTSGAAAVQRIRDGARFDLILCDLTMPGVSGMDVHDQLAQIAPDQRARMAFMSGGAFTPRARDFMAATALPHIEKPFDVTTLRDAVERLLARPMS